MFTILIDFSPFSNKKIILKQNTIKQTAQTIQKFKILCNFFKGKNHYKIRKINTVSKDQNTKTVTGKPWCEFSLCKL